MKAMRRFFKSTVVYRNDFHLNPDGFCKQNFDPADEWKFFKYLKWLKWG